jgi:hypothetical protein
MEITAVKHDLGHRVIPQEKRTGTICCSMCGSPYETYISDGSETKADIGELGVPHLRVLAAQIAAEHDARHPSKVFVSDGEWLRH